MIDRTKPLTEQNPGDLRVLIDALHANRERYDRANRIVEARSCELEIAEATRALAIINRRATEAADQRAAEERNHLLSIRQLVVKADVGGLWRAELATFDRVTAAPAQPALSADEVREVVRKAIAADHGWMCTEQRAQADAIAARAAKELAGAVVSAEQREADLREAFIAGCERAMGAAFLDQRGQDAGAQICGPTPGDVEWLAAEYARSKAGG